MQDKPGRRDPFDTSRPDLWTRQDWQAFAARLQQLYESPGPIATRTLRAIELVSEVFSQDNPLRQRDPLESVGPAADPRSREYPNAYLWDDPKIAALYLLGHIPHPLSGRPGAETPGIQAAMEASPSGSAWDPAKHPRGGKNPGWWLAKSAAPAPPSGRSTAGAAAKSSDDARRPGHAPAQTVGLRRRRPCPPAQGANPGHGRNAAAGPQAPNGATPAKPAPAATQTNPAPASAPLPKGTKENGYQGLGDWSFRSKDEAYEFFEDLLPESDRPPGWKAKVDRGCVGLNSLRCGTPSRHVDPRVIQNTFTRPDAETFKNQSAAEDRVAELQKDNPTTTYYLVAMQIPTNSEGKRKFDRLGDGPFKAHDLNGVIDTRAIGKFNFATRISLPDGRAYWEWMNHSFDSDDPDPTTVRHSESLPNSNEPTFYIVVEKKAWDR